MGTLPFMRETLGSQKLSRYLERREEGDEEFGSRCKVGAEQRPIHRTRIHAYRTARSKPSMLPAAAIQTATRGEVKLQDWLAPPIEAAADTVAATG